RRRAADRRRPSPLRDGAGVSRGGRQRGERVAPRRRGPDGAERPDDLPDPPDRDADEAPPAARAAPERRRPRARGGVHPTRLRLPLRRARGARHGARRPVRARGSVHAVGGRGAGGGRLRRGRGGVPAPSADGRAGRGGRGGREDDAAEEHVLLPEAHLRAPAPAARALTDWLATCRAAVDDVRGVLAELPRRADREPVVGAGMGGDDTTAIDAAVERAVVARFDRGGGEFSLVSEELGVRRGGDGAWVVLDPIDGSINAKRGLPFFSLSVAVADGETMDDVAFGYVYDFGTGEEWTAERGAGAFL